MKRLFFVTASRRHSRQATSHPLTRVPCPFNRHRFAPDSAPIALYNTGASASGWVQREGSARASRNQPHLLSIWAAASFAAAAGELAEKCNCLRRAALLADVSGYPPPCADSSVPNREGCTMTAGALFAFILSSEAHKKRVAAKELARRHGCVAWRPFAGYATQPCLPLR